MSIKTFWRYYRDYVKADERPAALLVLEDLFEKVGPTTDFMRIAGHFGRDHGALPDQMHSAVILVGGEYAKEYLNGLSGKMVKEDG